MVEIPCPTCGARDHRYCGTTIDPDYADGYRAGLQKAAEIAEAPYIQAGPFKMPNSVNKIAEKIRAEMNHFADPSKKVER